MFTSKTAAIKFAVATFRQVENAFEPEGWTNPIAKMIREMKKEEKQHRQGWAPVRSVSVDAAAKVLALSWLGKFYTGVRPLPTVGCVLVSTQTYIYAAAIVEQHRAILDKVFGNGVAEQCAALDYSELMAQ